MKALNLTITLLMFLQATMAFATPSKSEEIAYSMDKFQYDASVGMFKTESEIKAAATTLVSDLKAQGISEKEISNYVRGNLLTAEQRADFDRIITALDRQNAAKEEYVAQVTNYFQATAPQGSSYRRTVVYILPTGVVLTLVGLYLLVAMIESSRCNSTYYDDCRRVVI